MAHLCGGGRSECCSGASTPPVGSPCARGSYKWLRTGGGEGEGGGVEQLFDLTSDLNESVDLLRQHHVSSGTTSGGGGDDSSAGRDQLQPQHYRAKAVTEAMAVADTLRGLHAAWERSLAPIHASAASEAARRRECVKRQQQAARNKAKKSNQINKKSNANNINARLTIHLEEDNNSVIKYISNQL